MAARSTHSIHPPHSCARLRIHGPTLQDFEPAATHGAPGGANTQAAPGAPGYGGASRSEGPAGGRERERANTAREARGWLRASERAAGCGGCGCDWLTPFLARALHRAFPPSRARAAAGGSAQQQQRTAGSGSAPPGAGAGEAGGEEGYTDTNDDFCGVCYGGGRLLLCDECEHSFHIYCLDPPFEKEPEGDWLCPSHGKRGHGFVCGDWLCPSHGERGHGGGKGVAGRSNGTHVPRQHAGEGGGVKGGKNGAGQTYRPPRVDAERFQVEVSLLLPAAERASRRAVAAGGDPYAFSYTK
ncbi:hypothetical protein T492DRAFT_834762 [Pavlovales sp. CCMP2436]|nr:hypothetical protein T492DRAFT_834762 [Pavlovales sp. CCMP2436]